MNEEIKSALDSIVNSLFDTYKNKKKRADQMRAELCRYFEYICEEDQRRFVKKFRDQSNDSDQIMHTYRELILGAYLSVNCLNVRHDYLLHDKTPDWCIFDNTSVVIGFIELTNFHIDKPMESEIKRQIEAQGIALYHPDNFNRLYHCICYKAEKYQALAKKLHMPYVVAIFGLFEPAVDFEEVELCIFHKDTGLFKIYPEVSGVLYFRESLGGYLFNYACNPNGLHGFELPSGAFLY
jgi:hypothetical protein